MTMYAVWYEKNVDEELQSGILLNECYENNLTAFKKMLDEAQSETDSWNENGEDKFDLHIYTQHDSCSVSSHESPYFYNLKVIEMEVK